MQIDDGAIFAGVIVRLATIRRGNDFLQTMPSSTAQLPKTAAEVSPVREVTLFARADLTPFVELLEPQALQPKSIDGKAELMMSATDTRFYGIRFREFSINVLLEDAAANARNEASVFLIRAFNTVRFFAWVERTVFRTPYDHAVISGQYNTPVKISVTRRARPIVDLCMADIPDREPLRSGEDNWTGRIHLPTPPGKQAPADAKMFFGELSGQAEVYAFDEADQIRLHEQSDYPILQTINAANFQPKRWLIRQAGRHKKTKTVPRSWTMPSTAQPNESAD